MSLILPSPSIETSFEVLRLPTSLPGLSLRTLARRDAGAFYALVQRSRTHLTRYGDYEDLVLSTLADFESHFTEPPGDYLRMGIWLGRLLVGRADLNPLAPGVLVLSYWLGKAYTGRGFATAACRALIEYARETRPGSVFWAGVRHENHKSAAVLERLGFRLYEALPDRMRYRLE